MELKLNLFELEPLILSQCLKDKIFFLKIKDSIKSEYFQNQKLGQIFDVLNNYQTKYGTIPKLDTIETLFKRKFTTDYQEYVDIIKIIYEQENYDETYIVDSTISFIKQAKVIEAIRQSIPLIDKGQYGEIYNQIKDAVIVDFDKKLGFNFAEDAITAITEERKERIPTGFSQLDRVMNGGFEGGCVYVFSGIYGIGKSIWLQNIALKQLLNMKNVVFYTLELSERAVLRRLTSIYSQISQSIFLENLDNIKEQFKTLKMITDKNLWIKEYPTGTATVNTFRAHLEELLTTKECKPDIIIVDYANIMDATVKVSVENTYVRSKVIYEELRALAQEYNIPIATAAQINRGGMDEKKGGTKQLVTGANISDSLGISMTADGHFVINQTAEEQSDGMIRLFIDKNRQGPAKMSLAFGINYDCLSINEDVIIETK